MGKRLASFAGDILKYQRFIASRKFVELQRAIIISAAVQARAR